MADGSTERAGVMAAAATEDEEGTPGGGAEQQRWWMVALPVDQWRQLPEPRVTLLLDGMALRSTLAVGDFLCRVVAAGRRLADLSFDDAAGILREMSEARRAAAADEPSPSPYRDGGFGAVPASAAAVAGLERKAFFHGGAGGAAECAVCPEGLEDGEEVSVVPCAGARGHEFHAACIA
ncbi:hypothetical protein ACP4OV_014525 [Aristida adscensionis]